MQPYQEAAETMQRQGEKPKRLLQKAGSLATKAVGSVAGGIALNRVLPMLNQFIPESLAIKGLSKIDSRFGKFINKAKENGKTFDEIKNFIKEKAGLSGDDNRNPQNNENIIQQYSPDLFQFIKGEIENGMPPQKAGAVARLMNKDFEKAIKQIEKDHKTDFSVLLQNIFGSTEQPQAQQEPQQMQQQQMQQDSGQQSGGVSTELMQIMQSMQSTMNKFRGR